MYTERTWKVLVEGEPFKFYGLWHLKVWPLTTALIST